MRCFCGSAAQYVLFISFESLLTIVILDMEDNIAVLEQKIGQLHCTIGGVMTVLERGFLVQRVERCESQVDRLSKLVQGLCQHVGFDFGLVSEGYMELDATLVVPPSVNVIPPTPQTSQEGVIVAPVIMALPPSSATIAPAIEDDHASDVPAALLPAALPPCSATAAPATQDCLVLDEPSALSIPAATLPSSTTAPAADSMPPVDNTNAAGYHTIRPAARSTNSPSLIPPVLHTTSLPTPAIQPSPHHSPSPASPPAPDSPRPPGSRLPTPAPTSSDMLGIPGPITRSRSRSLSPIPEMHAGKRKADGSTDDEGDRKKRRV